METWHRYSNSTKATSHPPQTAPAQPTADEHHCFGSLGLWCLWLRTFVCSGSLCCKNCKKGEVPWSASGVMWSANANASCNRTYLPSPRQNNYLLLQLLQVVMFSHLRACVPVFGIPHKMCMDGGPARIKTHLCLPTKRKCCALSQRLNPSLT